jgi:IS5 family transposase
MKTVGWFRRTRYRGLDRTGLAGHLVGAAYNLVRMAKLLGPAKATPVAQVA